MPDLELNCRLVVLDEHELFWLDCLRAGCNGQVPRPTLEHAQALRRLFSQMRPQTQNGAGHGQP